MSDDAVHHPAHYTTGRFIHSLCGKAIEVIDVTQELGFCDGNTVKYVLRAGHKGDRLEDLKKARKYLDFEIARLERELAKAETEAILEDPATMSAIREGDADWQGPLPALPAKWGATPLPNHDPGCALMLPHDQCSTRAEGELVVTVRYVPSGNDDPWGGRKYTEILDGPVTVDWFRYCAVMHFGFGIAESFDLFLPGTDAPLSLAGTIQGIAQDAHWTGILELRQVRDLPPGEPGSVASPTRTRL